MCCFLIDLKIAFRLVLFPKPLTLNVQMLNELSIIGSNVKKYTVPNMIAFSVSLHRDLTYNNNVDCLYLTMMTVDHICEE